jgi:DNA-binding YbaB/EbfC family protein
MFKLHTFNNAWIKKIFQTPLPSPSTPLKYSLSRQRETQMFKGLGQMGDMAKMMQAAQDMQGKMAKLQEDMHNQIVTGESGAGLVKATCTAKGELKSLDIDPSIFSSDDKEVVEDLILAAIKDAQIKAADKAQSEMGKITEAMGLPKDMKLPF